MSRTIKVIERHMITPVRLGPRSSRLRPEATARQAAQPLQNGGGKPVAEWQRGLETVTGSAQRKLRLFFAPAQSPATSNC